MKFPRKPPSVAELLSEAEKAGRVHAVLQAAGLHDTDVDYLHWDKLRHLSPPHGLTDREWWLAVKLRRAGQYRTFPLRSTDGRPFCYALPDPIPRRLHEVDLRVGGSVEMRDPITNPDTRDRYLVSSLIEEAITSSQLEGAATTREVAKQMIRSGRKPHDHAEKMILNNYLTMQQIIRTKKRKLTKDFICYVHKLVTKGTLEDPADEGRLRTVDRSIDIGDLNGQVFHTPPPAEQLEERIAAMCDFANRDSAKEFVHPVLRAIMLHFWLAYDHPFVDGNGRTARALFYWSMLRNGYWLCEFISISEIILKAPAKYGKAFLYTETDDCDLTYFLLFNLNVIHRAIAHLYQYVDRKTKQLRILERELRATAALNHRQRALVSHALRHPDQEYTAKSHGLSHNVVHRTALNDLIDLAERGILRQQKLGKQFR